MRRQCATVGLLVASFGIPRVASGSEQPPPAPPETTSFRAGGTVTGMVGLGTPLGLYGLEITGDPSPWFSIAMGAGKGWSSEHPLQLASMLRARWIRQTNVALTGGLGISRGGFEVPICFDLGCGGAGDVWWTNAEMGVEVRGGGSIPLVARAFVGWSVLVDPQDLQCEHCGLGGRLQLPYIGLALGAAIR